MYIQNKNPRSANKAERPQSKLHTDIQSLPRTERIFPTLWRTTCAQQGKLKVQNFLILWHEGYQISLVFIVQKKYACQ